ncbi:ASCH domain-containing protein [Thalassobacillus devorans]|uniref:ASCH domain-containing protein n=1 Tax=Thalassobacillus devorans TaxID=279813 RepID=UPI00048DB58D|nr:ASCH domain-containing protein [Thalassobacillus devorans]
MNEAAQKYWNDYLLEHPEEKTTPVTAWQFGADPDELAQLVIDGYKTATCSGHVFYELESEPIPAVGEYSIILNNEDLPVAIIKTIQVEILPMNEVSEEFAIAEGEGDRTYRYWWEAHERFFRRELHEVGMEFSENMLLVCERFELVDVYKNC